MLNCIGVGNASGAVAGATSTLLGQMVFPLMWLPRGEGELRKLAAGDELWLVTMADTGETSLEPEVLTPFDDVEYCCSGLDSNKYLERYST